MSNGVRLRHFWTYLGLFSSKDLPRFLHEKIFKIRKSPTDGREEHHQKTPIVFNTSHLLTNISKEIIKILNRCTTAPLVAAVENNRKPHVRPRTPAERLLILHDCFNLLWPVSFKWSAA